MLIPPPIPAPDTLKGVDDLIRSGFEQFSELWFRRLLEATALVAIGLLFELPEIWHESVEAIKELLDCGPEKRIKPWAKLFGTLGWILIVGGVCGEFWAESVTSRADGFIRKFDEILLAEANRNAGSAADSAKTARNEADAAVKSASDARTIANSARLESHAAAKLAGKAGGKAEKVGEKADEISARLDTASQQLSQVEERVRVQGPRWKLLIDGEKAFVEALKPFKGQKVIMAACAPRQSPSQSDEEYAFELTLLNRLVEPRPGSVPGAGWTVLTVGAYACKASGWSRGVWVMYNAPAVKAAAEALGSALNKLKINADTIPITGPASEYARQKRKPDDLNALWEVVASDPTGIYILTGENPQTFDPRK